MPFKVKYDEKKAISSGTGININTLFCGYLRQPILAEEGETGYFIQGFCMQTRKTCLRFIDKDVRRCHHEQSS